MASQALPRVENLGSKTLKFLEMEEGLTIKAAAGESKVLEVSQIDDLIEFVGVSFEIFGVGVIAVGILSATVGFLRSEISYPGKSAHHTFKVNVGLSLLLGLEILVAADIIKSVAADDSLESLGILAILVGIRTFLTWTITLEVEGRWPWQKNKERPRGPDP